MGSPDTETGEDASAPSVVAPVRRSILGADAALSVLDYGQPGAESKSGCPEVHEHQAPLGMILLHGIRDHAAALDEVARGFRGRFHVVSLDLRGHGHSAHTGAYSFALMVADLLSVVRHFAFDRFVIVRALTQIQRVFVRFR